MGPVALARIAGSLVLVLGQEDGLVRPRDGDVLLPAGAVAELLERVDLASPRAGLDLRWPRWSGADAASEGVRWSDAAPWERWVELVRAEAAATTPDPARRAALAALAREQGRDHDAWRHLRACASDPSTVAALFPLFLPGIPAELAGRPAPWPAGILLRPALPPLEGTRSSLRGLAGLALEHADVRVGGARFSLRVDVDHDGLGVTLNHRSGEAVDVRVEPPVLPGVEIDTYFADWEKLAPTEQAARFQLSADAPEHSLWASFQPPEARWPAPPIDTIAPLQHERVLVLVRDHEEARLERCAAALGLLLGVTARVERSTPADAGWLEPWLVELDGPRAEAKLVTVIGLAEGLVLAQSAWERGPDGR
jgi:hypothetical protein